MVVLLYFLSFGLALRLFGANIAARWDGLPVPVKIIYAPVIWLRNIDIDEMGEFLDAYVVWWLR